MSKQILNKPKTEVSCTKGQIRNDQQGKAFMNKFAQVIYEKLKPKTHKKKIKSPRKQTPTSKI